MEEEPTVSLRVASEQQPESGMSIEKMWAEAAEAFEKICGESLRRGEVKNFDDVQRKIEDACKARSDVGQEDKWERAKSVGLQSLKYLQMLVGVASKASSLVPIPAVAADISSSALCFVFDIPKSIKGYNDAIDQVFGEVSSALSQFRIYESMDYSQNIDLRLLKQIQLVMISFVKICAHVVKYRQGRWKTRFLQQVKSIFNDDSGLASAMDDFKRALQQQRDVEGTITLAVVVETREDIALLLEKTVAFSTTAEETHQAVQETRKGVQAINDKSHRRDALIKIRDTLGVWSTVRLDTQTTQTCTDIYNRCLDDTGAWIWTHDAYLAWTAPKDTEVVIPHPHVLLLSGSESSGKTSASALVTKRLEEQGGRVYVAHYFFPTTTGRTGDEKNAVPLALKYMAFQIARVDTTVRNALSKACSVHNAFRRSSSATLDDLWSELKIGAPGSSATYYLIFDGVENLSDEQATTLLTFIFRLEPRGPVRVLASATDDLLKKLLSSEIIDTALQIQMNMFNGPDISIFIDNELTKRGIPRHADIDSKRQKARAKIVDKLPQNVQGNYSLLQIGLDNVVRLLSIRSTAEELDQVLAQPTNSHEMVIDDLQRSLTEAEVNELNELLKWVLFSKESMKLDQLEAVMFLYSGKESLTSLEDIISAKYSAVFKIEGCYVYGQDGVEDYFTNQKHTCARPSRIQDHATISMTININNVDQESCSHFLWNLAQKSILEKFDFDKAMTSSRTRGVIAVDAFEAHHTIVTRTFDYLSRETSDQIAAAGCHLVSWLPYHLDQLRELEDDEKGELTPYDKFDIGHELYTLFQNNEVFLRHRESFEQSLWWADEMDAVQKWLMDPVVVRRLDKKWRNGVQMAASPTKGYLKPWVKTVVEGFLKGRSWDVRNASYWISEFMEVDSRKDNEGSHQPEPPTSSGASADDDANAEPSLASVTEIDWDSVSTWCQTFLELQDFQLDSLWYERLAEASSFMSNKPDVTISLWQRAIEKDNPSWRCYYNLGKLLYDQGRTEQSVTQAELGLKEAERRDAVPKPETKDIVDLHLLLWQIGGGDVQDKVERYLAALGSEDVEQVRQARLGYLIASLRSDSPDVEALRQSLKDAMSWDDGRDIITILKILACNSFQVHDTLIWKLCAVAIRDPYLLGGITRIMNTAIEGDIVEQPVAGDSLDEYLSGDESRGVLLYYRGLMAYTYKVSSTNSDPTCEALRSWGQSLGLLSNIAKRSYNAYIVQQCVRAALAKHFFQLARDGDHEDETIVEELVEIAKNDPVISSDATHFVCSLYALQEKRPLVREVLGESMKEALQILSDDTPDNDIFGFSRIKHISEAYQDFKNVAVALSLVGQPDLVADALYFEEQEIDEGLDKGRVADTMARLAREIVQVVSRQIPDTSQQIQRIAAAKAYVDSLLAPLPKIGVLPEAHDDNDDSRYLETHANEDISTTAPVELEPETAAAYRLLQTHLSDLQQTHTPELNSDAFQWNWSCDGRTPDGKRCPATSNFEHEFYHCVYCADRDFCADCLKRLRNPTDSDINITVCSAKHCWLEVPPHGNDMYVGSRAHSVRLPQEVKPMEEDDQILQILYAEDGSGEEITVEEWKDKLAKEWEIEI